MISNNLLQKLWGRNTDEIIKDINMKKIPKWLDIKIQNESDRKGYNYEDIIDEIKNSRLYASCFAKDPMKQNIAEKIQMILLKKIYPEIKKLPNGGKNALYISNGKLSNKKGKSTAKSIDFKYNEVLFYAKYTKERGGAQDNQYNDCKNFIREAKKFTCNKYLFVLVIDGDYYDEEKINNLLELADCQVDIINTLQLGDVDDDIDVEELINL